MTQQSTFERAVAMLTAGRPVVFPTDTVYGIGVPVALSPTPHVLYKIKQRDSDKAIPWLVGRETALNLYGRDVAPYVFTLAHTFWPGPLTIIVKAADNVPKAFQAENGTIALRMPNDDLALKLINTVGFPLATSSANLQGEKPPATLAEVDERILSQVSAYIGDDDPREGVSSTVIDCSGEEIRVLREGPLTLDDLQKVLEK